MIRNDIVYQPIKRGDDRPLVERSPSCACLYRGGGTSRGPRVNRGLVASSRYRALERLREERDALILSHVTFVQRPSCDCCPFREHCADLVMPAVLHSKLARWVKGRGSGVVGQGSPSEVAVRGCWRRS